MSEKLKALLIDDSAQALRLLQLMLQELAPNVTVIGLAKNGSEALQMIEENTPDVLFLDIEMPEKSGIQLAEELINRNINCNIVFTTAYNQYAIKAFRLSAVDYLLKPIDETQLLQAVEKLNEKQHTQHSLTRLNALTQNLQHNNTPVLSFPVLNGYEYIPLSEIVYLEADGSYVHLFLTDGKEKTASKNLKYFEQVLDCYPNFMRVHRSYLINLYQMQAFSKEGRGTILMKNGKSIDLARHRRTQFIDVLETL